MPLHPVCEDLWTLRTDLRLFGVDMQRRMQVVRAPGSDELALISPVPLSAGEVAAVAEVGRVACIIAPSRMHDTGVVEASGLFPDAQVVVATALKRDFPNATPLTPKRFADLSPWAGLLEPIPLAGMPRVGETLFYHEASESLLVADAIFALDGAEGGLFSRIVYRLYGVHGYVGPSRLYRLMIKDKAAFRASVAILRERPVRRIVTCHGGVVEESAAVAAALERLLTA